MIVAEGARFPDQGPLTLGDHPDPFGNLRLGGIGGVIAEAIEQADGFRNALRGPGPPPAWRAAQRLRPHPGHPAGLAAGRLVLQKRFGTIVTLPGARSSKPR